MLSERELLLKTAEATDLSRTPVREVMRQKPTVLREDDLVAEAFHRMATSNHRHVPVRLKDGSYVVVSARGLLRYLCQ
jgi:CBS domain-containing protein